MTQFFFWTFFNYIIWLPLGKAIGASIGSIVSLVLTCFAIACGMVALLLLAGLFLKMDGLKRFGS